MAKDSATKMPLETGASRLVGPDTPIEVPKLSRRQHYAMHAPTPPNWWKVQTPLDLARWSWAWADAMIQVEDEPTNPTSAERPGLRRP